MNHFSYNQPDYRDLLSTIIEVFSPLMNEHTESILRSMSANSYGSDYRILMNALNGVVYSRTISRKTIDNAAEYYKQVNKVLLSLRDLTPVEKIFEAKKIDDEADRLKNKWGCTLMQKGIYII